MKPVFEYLEYRSYLKDAFDERKASNPFFSYRVLAEALGLDTSNLFRILHEEAHLPARCQPQTLEFLGLSGRSAEYYNMLVAYSRERGAKSKNDILEKAMSLRDVARRQLEEEQLASYFGNWWVVAVRSLLEVTDGRCVPAELARRLSPSVPETEIERSLKILEDLGLVKKASSGRLVLAEAHVTAGGEVRTKAVRQFQMQILALASESLERFAREDRDVSTLTLALDAPAFAQVREILRECRRQIQKCVEEAQMPDRVMQLSMAFFPLAPVEGKGP
ncbi:MAG TPA: TIGR02147 family protein [Fibrobacteria bacterium]|nr:TIGR02147 family protein [Fibrobacteria bacterium]